MARRDAFTEAYIEAALWSSNDESDEQGGEPLDANYGPSDIAPATLKAMERDCADFQEKYGQLVEDDDSPAIERWGRWELAGHDFWLTRNGHGAGFGDGNFPKHDDELSDAAQSYGYFELYVGDDGVIYAFGHESDDGRVTEAGGGDWLEYNTQLAKLMQRLKRDAGASTIAQNYRGTGSQAFRRQLWIHFKSGAVIDVWLENGYAKLGGVVMNAPPGGQPLTTRNVPYAETPEQTYAAVLAVLNPWANPGAPRASERRGRELRDGRRSYSMTYGTLPPFERFIKDIRRPDPDYDDGRAYWPEGTLYPMELVDSEEIDLAEAYGGLQSFASRYSHKAGYRGDEQAIYGFLQYLADAWNNGNEAAGDLASPIMTTLGYEWI